jgi:hypothetical protein
VLSYLGGISSNVLSLQLSKFKYVIFKKESEVAVVLHTDVVKETFGTSLVHFLRVSKDVTYFMYAERPG